MSLITILELEYNLAINSDSDINGTFPKYGGGNIGFCPGYAVLKSLRSYSYEDCLKQNKIKH